MVNGQLRVASDLQLALTDTDSEDDIEEDDDNTHPGKRLRLAEPQKAYVSDTDDERDCEDAKGRAAGEGGAWRTKSQTDIRAHLRLLGLPGRVGDTYWRLGIKYLHAWQESVLQVTQRDDDACSAAQTRSNLIIEAPTGGGKSLVGDVLLLKRVFETGKLGLILLPFVSVCEEKYEHLTQLLEGTGKIVKGCYGVRGGLNGAPGPEVAVLVCTFERANSVLRSLIEEKRVRDICAIVVDEIHMLADAHRGASLEAFLAKVLYFGRELHQDLNFAGPTSTPLPLSDGMTGVRHRASEKRILRSAVHAFNRFGGQLNNADHPGSIQIVAMSACLAGKERLASWLHAHTYKADDTQRPIQLKEYLCNRNGEIYGYSKELVPADSKLRLQRKLDIADFQGKRIPDDIAYLTTLLRECIAQGGSCLVFCSSRMKAQRCCADILHACSTLHMELPGAECSPNHTGTKACLLDNLMRAARNRKTELWSAVRDGCAFHHAGVSVDERNVVEHAFRTGLVRVLVATSTLGAGVNLPARRVIFFGLDIGVAQLDPLRYYQMKGRAGRMGYDTAGDSYVVVRQECRDVSSHSVHGEQKSEAALGRPQDHQGAPSRVPEEDLAQKLILASSATDKGFDPICSAIFPDAPSACTSRDTLCRVILEGVGGGWLASLEDIGRYMSCTFGFRQLLVNSKEDAGPRQAACQEILSALARMCEIPQPAAPLVKFDGVSGSLAATDVGYAASIVGGRVSLDSILECINEIVQASGSLSLDGDLHLLYLVVPHEWLAEDRCWWLRLHKTWPRVLQSLNAADLKVCGLVGLAEVSQTSMLSSSSYHPKHLSRKMKRLTGAVLMREVINEVPLDEVCKRFQLTPSAIGELGDLQDHGHRTAGQLAALCESLKDSQEFQQAGFWAFMCLLGELRRRLGFGVRSELIALMDIPHMTASRARELYRAGYRTPLQVAQASVDDLTGHLVKVSGPLRARDVKDPYEEYRYEIERTAAKNIISSAKSMVCREAEEAQATAIANVQLAKRLGRTADREGTLPRSEGRDSNMVESVMVVGHSQEDEWKQFLSEWRECRSFAFSFLVHRGSSMNPKGACVSGAAIAVDINRVCFVEMNHDGQPIRSRWAEFWQVFSQGDSQKISSGIQDQMVALIHACPEDVKAWVGLKEPYVDVLVAEWMLKPGEETLKKCGTGRGGFNYVEQPRLEPSFLARCSPSDRARVQSCLHAVANLGRADAEGTFASTFQKNLVVDCCCTALQSLCLWFWQRKQLGPEGLMKPLVNIEMPLVCILVDMCSMGIAYDESFFDEHYSAIKGSLDRLQEQANRLVGRSDWSLDSYKDVSDVLFHDLKLPLPPSAQLRWRSRSQHKAKMHRGDGQYSTNFKVLHALDGQHDIIPIIRDYRKLASVCETLCECQSRTSSKLSGHPGRLTASWKHLCSETGRLTCDGPNLQCVNKPVEYLDPAGRGRRVVALRDLFVAPRGCCLISCDYSEVELRLVAHFSGDPALCKAFATSNSDAKDVFSLVSEAWAKFDSSWSDAERRNRVKQCTYAVMYGAGTNTIAEILGCENDTARNVLAAFEVSFPQMFQWFRRVADDCRRTGYIQTLSGRRRYFAGIRNRASEEGRSEERAAVNSITQGSAADLLKEAMLLIYEKLMLRNGPWNVGGARVGEYRDCKIVLEMHDELIMEVPCHHVEHVAAILKQCMTSVGKGLRVPLEVKLTIGHSWGKLAECGA